MAVEVRDNPAQARYEVLSDGALAGFAQYQPKATRITIFHTEVDPEFEGRGLGSQPAREELADVCARGLELVPLCPFLARYVRRHPDEYLDLVPESIREKVMAGG